MSFELHGDSADDPHRLYHPSHQYFHMKRPKNEIINRLIAW
jgi:hypothetical protein